MMEKKVVVIGSGLGGLSCGAILAKNGYDVIVLEQSAQVGGCLQCFCRDGVSFETGMHYIGAALKGQTLYAIMHYLGIDIEEMTSQLDTEGYDLISFGGNHYRRANGHEPFINALTEQFPDSRAELEAYYDTVKKVASASSIHSLSGTTDMDVFTEYQARSIGDVIDGIVKNQLLREILTSNQMLYAGEKYKTPFSTHALIADSYNQSAVRIVGGSQRIALGLKDTITKMGGQVLTRQKVTHIECDEYHATGVTTDRGEHFAADIVISSIHPQLTMQLVNSALLRPAYRHRIETMNNTTSVFSVYLKFRPGTTPYMNHNLYYYRSDSVWGCDKYDEQSWPKCLLYMHSCHDKEATFAQTGEIMTYMDFSEMKPWLGTTIGRRGEAYETFKRQKAEAAIQTLEEEIPGFSNCIEGYYTSTPLSYLDYTGTCQGALYGLAKDVSLGMGGHLSHRTRIPNLLLAGQSTTLHGMLGVLAGSMMACSEIIPMQTLMAQINH